MINEFRLIRNIGAFDSVDTGAQLPFNTFAFIYAENGRGKTTLSSILRSFATGNPVHILERRRLGSQHAPHVVMAANGGHQAVFQNGAWSAVLPDIVIFDDHFISENICSGMQVETEQRQKLHELIIGAQGVTLNSALQEHVNRVEQHNRDLQTKGAAIPVEARGGLSLDDFCALEQSPNIDQEIEAAERSLAAARQADQVTQHPHFLSISLPSFNLTELESLLDQELPDLEAEALVRVQEHFSKIGNGGENWVNQGISRIEGASDGADHEVCPLCAQDLTQSPLIAHYQAYFSAAYRDLNQAISSAIQELNASHSGQIQAAFERSVRVWESTRQFWASFADVPIVNIDTAAVALAWRAAFESVMAILQTKQSSPLDKLQLGEELRERVHVYNTMRDQVLVLNEALLATRTSIDLVKEKAAAGNVNILQTDLARLQAIRARHSPDIVALCEDYLQEKQKKTETEGLRDAARTNLDQYRNLVFPQYEAAINDYLRRFNAGFRLDSVRSINTRGGSTCNYSVLINQQPVAVSTSEEGQPSFKTTLSAGDRNTLALAFFFASLENDPHRNQRIVVIDDPMTSLDEHRALTTIQEIRRLADDVAQIIVLSHSKTFLCDLWKDTDTTRRSACRIVRSNPGSTLSPWDVNQDCITEHDRRHALVTSYIQNSVGQDERTVAAALRPILESFVRVAYPESFPPGSLLGPFIGICQQREGVPNQILSTTDREELRALLDYANLFHHDTNAAWQTVIINDQQLLDFSRRTLAFAKR